MTPPPALSVVAILAAYNEADIIEEVVTALIQDGIQVYLVDDGSTDDTVGIVERYLNRGVVGIERQSPPNGSIPPIYEWSRLLERKTQLAKELDASWFIHADADEFRESPWLGVSLLDAIQRVDALGFNAIDFACLNFWPVHDNFRPGDGVRSAFPFYEPAADHDRLQVRCWKKTDAAVDLVSSGGHDAVFDGRRVFPIRFILRHYPIRGQAHGARKVFEERRARFGSEEREQGWHVQYDHVQEGESFIRPASTLIQYDPAAVRLSLTLRHRGVEELEAAAAAARAELDREITSLRAALEARALENGRLERLLAQREAELAERDITVAEADHALQVSREECALLRRDVAAGTLEIGRQEALLVESRAALDGARSRVEALLRSWSWRCMAPARAAYRFLTRRK